MEIRILHDQGIVLYIGKKDSNFICLSLQNGLLEFRIKTGICFPIVDPVII